MPKSATVIEPTASAGRHGLSQLNLRGKGRKLRAVSPEKGVGRAQLT